MRHETYWSIYRALRKEDRRMNPNRMARAAALHDAKCNSSKFKEAQRPSGCDKFGQGSLPIENPICDPLNIESFAFSCCIAQSILDAYLNPIDKVSTLFNHRTQPTCKSSSNGLD